MGEVGPTVCRATSASCHIAQQRILLRREAAARIRLRNALLDASLGHWAGHENTFSKGTQEPGLTAEINGYVVDWPRSPSVPTVLPRRAYGRMAETSPNHHWAMDRHLIAPCPDSTRAAGVWQVNTWCLDDRIDEQRELVGLADKPVIPPTDKQLYPALESLRWRQAHQATTCVLP